MPYLIYNDNDTEAEVNIAVSISDADAVEYHSEHFFGMLEDKTFTDEDMQAADHYLLTNGHDLQGRRVNKPVICRRPPSDPAASPLALCLWLCACHY